MLAVSVTYSNGKSEKSTHTTERDADAAAAARVAALDADGWQFESWRYNDITHRSVEIWSRRKVTVTIVEEPDDTVSPIPIGTHSQDTERANTVATDAQPSGRHGAVGIVRVKIRSQHV